MTAWPECEFREPNHSLAGGPFCRRFGLAVDPATCRACRSGPMPEGGITIPPPRTPLPKRPPSDWRPDHEPIVLALFVGYKDPEFLADDAEAFRHYHRDARTRFEIAFLVDGDAAMAGWLSARYGLERVYCTQQANGWGRGILRGIVHALAHFRKRFEFTELLSFDDDALTVGSVLDQMVAKIDAPNVLFVGTTWRSPPYDAEQLPRLREAGYLANQPWKLDSRLAAGCAMLWTKACLDFLSETEFLDPDTFDGYYPAIRFCHDQIGAFLLSAGCGDMRDCSELHSFVWRRPLTHRPVAGHSNVPIVRPGVGVIHPVRSEAYVEADVRRYFRAVRGGTLPIPDCGCRGRRA